MQQQEGDGICESSKRHFQILIGLYLNWHCHYINKICIPREKRSEFCLLLCQYESLWQSCVHIFIWGGRDGDSFWLMENRLSRWPGLWAKLHLNIESVSVSPTPYWELFDNALCSKPVTQIYKHVLPSVWKLWHEECPFRPPLGPFSVHSFF